MTVEQILQGLPNDALRLEYLERVRMRNESFARDVRLQAEIVACREGDPFPLIRVLWPKLVLDDWQADTIAKFFDPRIREVFIKGNTGSGKTCIAGISVCLYFIIWDDARIVLTRDTHDSARRIFFAEVVSWWKSMSVDFPHVWVGTEKIEDKSLPQDSRYVAVVNPKAPEGFSGTHSGHVAHFYDEATAEVLQGRYKLSYTQAHSFMALGNPRVTSGEFYRAFPIGRENETHTFAGPYGRRHVVTVSGKDCRNVKEKCLSKAVAPPRGIEINGHEYRAGEDIPMADMKLVRPIIPGQTCYDDYLALCNNPDPDFVSCYAHGCFPESDRERQLFMPQNITRSQQRHTKWLQLLSRAERAHAHLVQRLLNRVPVDAFGLDVAQSDIHGDWTVLTAGGHLGIRKQHEAQISNVMEVTAWVLQTITREYGLDLTRGDHPICIDWGGGYGSGVGDRLSELGCQVIKFIPNNPSELNPKRYQNLRCEGYSEFANRLDPEFTSRREASEDLLDALEDLGELYDRPIPRVERMPDFLIPESTRLFEDLRVLEKHFQSDGFRYKLTPKRSVPGREAQDEKIEPIVKRLGRSPDHGDSAMYCFHAVRHVKDSIADWINYGAF